MKIFGRSTLQPYRNYLSAWYRTHVTLESLGHLREVNRLGMTSCGVGKAGFQSQLEQSKRAQFVLIDTLNDKVGHSHSRDIVLDSEIVQLELRLIKAQSRLHSAALL